MTTMVRLLSPIAESRRPDKQLASPLEGLEGKKVAILNNGWTSMDVLASSLERHLKEEYGVKEVQHWDIPIARAASKQTFEEVLAFADAAVVGLAN
jgi:hypothetical protein